SCRIRLRHRARRCPDGVPGSVCNVGVLRYEVANGTRRKRDFTLDHDALRGCCASEIERGHEREYNRKFEGRHAAAVSPELGKPYQNSLSILIFHQNSRKSL